MAGRVQQPRVSSPKKVVRRKRTPHCDSCGKRDGDDAGGHGEEAGRKVRLKLCARCRAVAYCGMDCQKAGWKRHREVCVQYVNTAELPAPSPLVNHQKIAGTGPRGRRKVIYAGQIGTTPTPRQRENAPKKHPFFGRQESMDREARTAVPSPPPPAQVVTVRRLRELEQQQELLLQHQRQQQRQQQREEEAQKEDGCPSPPTMQRLSMPDRNSSRNRHDLRLSSNGSSGRRSLASSSKTPPTKDHTGPAGAAATATAGKAMSATRDNGSANASPPRRLSYSPAATRTRRSTNAPPHSVSSRGGASPPPLPPREAVTGRDYYISGRRESAPAYPVAVEDKRRVRASRASVSAIESSRRGPPPPYYLVAHRAGSMRKLSRSSAGSNNKGAVASGVSARDTVSPGSAKTTAKDKAIAPPPSVPLTTVSPGASLPPPSSAPPPLPLGDKTTPANVTNRSESASFSREKLSAEAARGATAKQSEPPTPERQKEEGAVAIEVIVAKDAQSWQEAESERDTQPASAESVARKEGSGSWLELPMEGREEVKEKAKEEEAKGEEAKEEEAKEEEEKEEEAKGNEANGEEAKEKKDVSKECNSETGKAKPEPARDDAQGEEVQVATRGEKPVPAEDSEGASMQGSTEVTVGALEENVVATRLPMNPPPPILPSSAVSSNVDAGMKNLLNSGVFDSCPSSAGMKGFATAKNACKTPPVRSLSVGTVPEITTVPLATLAKGMLTAATTAWGGNRKGSPRPRPPESPGPAPLSKPCPMKKTSSVSRPAAAAEGDGGRATKTHATNAEKGGSKASSPAQTMAAVITSRLASPKSPTFVPAIEISPLMKPPTPRSPGPRPTETAIFYHMHSCAPGVVDLPPPSQAYLGRPTGFSIHVLVASAISASDLELPADGSPVPRGFDCHAGAGGSMPPALKAARWEKEHRRAGRKGNHRWVYYSFEERGRVAGALQPGDVVLLTPGRYEAQAWGLKHLVSSVEIIGAGSAGACVVYNESATSPSSPDGEHFLVGVMGAAAVGVGGDGVNAPEVKGKDNIDDDSDSGWEDGAFGFPFRAKSSFSGRAVRVRLANLTLEQGSGYRGTVYQLGRDSHVEIDGCAIRCTKGGVNIDQGTCLISDSTISGSEVFGVHIGGDGAVEHCSISGCGRGGGRGGGGKDFSSVSTASSSIGGDENSVEPEDDGTDVNRMVGMPAISVLQSSRVRVRFNVIRGNAGHSLQCRDAPLPGGDDKQALLARRAEVEAEEKLRSWLGAAAVLLREHLQEQQREGSIIAEGNQCQRNKGCKASSCASSRAGGRRGFGTTPSRGARGDGSGAVPARGAQKDENTETVCPAGGGGVVGEGGSQEEGKQKLVGRSGVDGGSVTWNGAGQICIPTSEEEGLPLPAAMTLRFLAAMDQGYVGSMREENARARRKRMARDEGAG